MLRNRFGSAPMLWLRYSIYLSFGHWVGSVSLCVRMHASACFCMCYTCCLFVLLCVCVCCVRLYIHVRRFTQAAAARGEQGQTWFNYLYGKYIPFMVRERFGSREDFAAIPLVDAAGQPTGAQQFELLADAEMENFEAAVAFVDVSGFTKLSEKLIDDYGYKGAEKLNQSISGYFEKLIDVIVDFGGE